MPPLKWYNGWSGMMTRGVLTAAATPPGCTAQPAELQCGPMSVHARTASEKSGDSIQIIRNRHRPTNFRSTIVTSRTIRHTSKHNVGALYVHRQAPTGAA